MGKIVDDTPDPWMIETHRSGFFKFQTGVDLPALRPLLDRVEDAHSRFASVPILPDIANALEREVLVSSVFSTNTIEGGTLTKQETADIVQDPDRAKKEHEIRVDNMRKAYDFIEKIADDGISKHGKGGRIVIENFMLLDLHKFVTHGIQHAYNLPGHYRDNPKGLVTRVGDTDHGGIYIPPKCEDDISLLMNAFIGWLNSARVCDLSPLLRAPLAHYYFERIHPFWDGNGRVGRVLEAFILKCAGYKYAAFALSDYYLKHIDEYFSVFNLARKAEESGQSNPNTVFIEFFLKGMLEVLNKLHDRVNYLIAHLLYETMLKDKLDRKIINIRQYTIINNLLPKGKLHILAELQAQPWYNGLYKKLTPKTRSRDLKGLAENTLIRITPDNRLELLVPGMGN